jgi:hypothetical protein
MISMKRFVLTALSLATLIAHAAALEYKIVPDWLKLPEGRTNIGNMHGDVAVSSKGEVYVSVMDPKAGVQVYADDGKFLRVVPKAPSDFHGFVIHKDGDGEFIFGARLGGQTILKIALDGQVVLTIPASDIPDEFKNKNKAGKTSLALTAMDIAPNGDLFVTDGYASDYVHRFDRAGKYLKSFGGKKPPYSFSTLHKIAIDTRFEPARIIGCDRANGRVVHLSLDGEFLGVVAKDLLLPAAVAIYREYAAIGELKGRVTILDKEGKVVMRIGANTEPGVGGNNIKPEQWKPGVVISPHGVAFNERGDLFVSEYSLFGRVHRFNRE